MTRLKISDNNAGQVSCPNQKFNLEGYPYNAWVTFPVPFNLASVFVPEDRAQPYIAYAEKLYGSLKGEDAREGQKQRPAFLRIRATLNVFSHYIGRKGVYADAVISGSVDQITLFGDKEGRILLYDAQQEALPADASHSKDDLQNLK